MMRVQIKVGYNQLLEMATAFGVRVAWYRFGSPFNNAATIGNLPTAPFVPEVCGNWRRLPKRYQATRTPKAPQSDLYTDFEIKSEVTMSTDHALLTNVYNAFNARDIDAVLAFMHKDVDWPNGWEGGRVYGHQGVRDYWTRQWAAIDPHVEPVGFDTDETGRTVVKVHQVVRDLEGNVIAEGMVEHVYLIEDGLIRSMEIRQP